MNKATRRWKLRSQGRQTRQNRAYKWSCDTFYSVCNSLGGLGTLLRANQTNSPPPLHQRFSTFPTFCRIRPFCREIKKRKGNKKPFSPHNKNKASLYARNLHLQLRTFQWSWDSSVGIATGYMLDGRRFDSQHGLENFLFSTASRPDSLLPNLYQGHNWRLLKKGSSKWD
jgi:hypothetical protein